MKSPEENLWAAVVLRAVDDAVQAINMISRCKETNTNPAGAERELEYLMEQVGAPWFWQVCDWAGLDRAYVVDLLNKKRAGL